MKQLSCFGLLLAVMICCGCISLKEAIQKADVRTVQVAPHVSVERSMRYGVYSEPSYDPEQAEIQELAQAIVNGLGREDINRMHGVMGSHRILIPELVHQGVLLKLGQHPNMQIVDDDADAIFVVRIEQYGFYPKGIFKREKTHPFIELGAELRSRNGKRLWKNTSLATGSTSEGKSTTWAEYEADPEKLRQEWAKQIDAALKHLITERRAVQY